MTDIHGVMLVAILIVQILLWWHVTKTLHLMVLDSRKNIELFRLLINDQTELTKLLNVRESCPSTTQERC